MEKVEKSFLHVQGEYTLETVINRSRFIAAVLGEVDLDGAKEFIGKIKKEHSQATHNCYGYIVGEKSQEMKFSDDGEPQGTAGQPILEVLKKNGLTNTVLVVTRYFGGVKLGANGLVTAYTKSAVNVLETAQIEKKVFSQIVRIVCSYTDFASLNTYFMQNSVKVLSTEFDNNVKIVIAVPAQMTESAVAAVKNMTQGKANINKENLKIYI